MNASMLLVPLLALAVAGCGRSVVKESKETVIEKPVVAKESREIVVEKPVTREVIVEKPVLTKEVIVERPVPALRACAYGSGSYVHGSLSCQGGNLYRCSDGAWEGRSLSC